jgi:hypothetical protein
MDGTDVVRFFIIDPIMKIILKNKIKGRRSKNQAS